MADFTTQAKASGKVFQEILKKAMKVGISNASNRQARNWFRKAAQELGHVSSGQMMDGAGPFEKSTQLTPQALGKMYMFVYSAKTQDTLPFWDAFPLIFPISFYKDGFLGINLHYLPPYLRARLMDALDEIKSNDKYDNTTKLRISYEVLNSATRFGPFKPCVKRYLYSHVRSTYLYVKPIAWEIALMLPTQQFVKASDSTVWADSEKKIGF